MKAVYFFYPGKILADYECCICGKKKTAKGSSAYEQLRKCESENGAKALQQAADNNPENTRLRA